MKTTTTYKSHSGRFYLGRERQRETPDGRSYTGVSNNILHWPEEQRHTPDGRSFTGVSDNILHWPGEAEGYSR